MKIKKKKKNLFPLLVLINEGKSHYNDWRVLLVSVLTLLTKVLLPLLVFFFLYTVTTWENKWERRKNLKEKISAVFPYFV